jgi:hypothetical protein
MYQTLPTLATKRIAIMKNVDTHVFDQSQRNFYSELWTLERKGGCWVFITLGPTRPSI